MIANTRSRSGIKAILLLVGVYVGLVSIMAVTMPTTDCFAVGCLGTPIYLATHYLAIALGRRILRTRATVGRFLLVVFVVLFVYLSLPMCSLLSLGVNPREWPPVAAVLGLVGTAIVLVSLIFFEEPPEPSSRLYIVHRRRIFQIVQVIQGDRTHDPERESAR